MKTELEDTLVDEIWSGFVCTFTIPVFPHRVVTRIDCDSLIHTVFNSCLVSKDSVVCCEARQCKAEAVFVDVLNVVVDIKD